ncbi:MAG: hypothetical protein LBH10_00155 [Burkholderiaceae bacterium]|jgi:hypothetical protein|nr:hypothetical protein [Burkholderiaceae bacterium]
MATVSLEQQDAHAGYVSRIQNPSAFVQKEFLLLSVIKDVTAINRQTSYQ